MTRELIQGHTNRYEFESNDGQAIRGEPLTGLSRILSPTQYVPQTYAMADDGRTFLFGCEKPIADYHVQEIRRLGLKVRVDDKTQQQAL